MIDPAQLKPVAWSVVDSEPLCKLFWVCTSGAGEKWVEVFPVERLLNAAEIMKRVRHAIYDHCGPGGEVLFAGDSTLYYLVRVELRVDGVIDDVLKFHADLVQLDSHILIRIVTLAAIPASLGVPPVVVDRRCHRGTTLAKALEYAEAIANAAARHGGMIVFPPEPGLHVLDRIEVYYDGEFRKVIPLDYTSAGEAASGYDEPFLDPEDDVN